MADLRLEPDAALEIAERRFVSALRAYHCCVILIAGAVGRQDKMALAIQRYGLFDVDRIPAWAEPSIAPFVEIEGFAVELIRPGELVAVRRMLPGLGRRNRRSRFDNR